MLQVNIVNYQTGEFQKKTFQPESQDKLEWLVGRRPNCDLILTSPEISRIHGKFLWEQNSYYFIDLGSTDGSRINSKDLEAERNYPIQENDLILIGNFVLAIEKMDTKIASEEPDYDKTTFSNRFPQWNSEDLLVKCQHIIHETHDVKTFRFVAESPVSFVYQPGQFVNLELEIEGKPVVRSYSISSTPSRPSTLEITVKRVPAPKDSPNIPPGLVSNWLHDNLKVGSQVKLIGGAMGKFTCTTKPSRKILMISAGSGITPMISMSRWIYDTVADCDVVFFHNARTPQDIIMRQELETLAARHPNFRLVISLTRPELTQPWQSEPWLGLTGRFNHTILNTIAPNFKERTIYVCGPDGFMQQVKETVYSQNFPMEKYHQESFGGRKQKPKKSSPQPSVLPPKENQKSNATPSPTSDKPAVLFSQLGREILCDEEESILEVAEQEGVAIRSGCRQGVCGACKVRKLDGEIRYEGDPDGLSNSDKDSILSCIAFPVGKVTIEA